ncbi:helix-hairpin-helix domain-containing protein [Micromonospora sp. NPDC047074]|uniref:helix-hairpin-helix domain-containing protein n=1 Tax=Micromonospora sp. NPDC047074 TaxID=3154339 RepID=UPI0033F9DDBA
MSDDEETVVRERLRRLVGAPPAVAAGPDGLSSPAGSPGPGLLPPEAPETAPTAASAPAPISAFVSAPIAASTSARVAAGVAALPEPDPPGQAPGAGAETAAPSRLAGPGAFDPGRRGVRALAVVAALVVLGAGLWAWRSRPQAEPVHPVATAEAPGAATGLAEPAASPAGELVVAVAGKVRRPGLVRVPAGARVADAVEAAGGALPGVDVALLNPARKLTDGELILVGVAAPPGAAPSPGTAAGGAPGTAPGAGGRLNLNTATLAQLDALPGVGPVLAQRILAHRDQHGGFRSVGDLRQVDGIGDARYEQLKDLVTV